MHIVFLTFRYHPSVGGVEKYVAELGRALCTLGHRVTVVTGAHAAGLASREWCDGIEVRRLPAHRSRLRFRLHLLNLRRLFVEADVVHISDVLMAEEYFATVARTLRRRPVFLTRHGLSYKWPVPEMERRRAEHAASRVEGIVDDGRFIARWLELDPGTVLDQGLSPPAESILQKPEPAPDSAVFVGRLDWDTGIQAYVDAIELLRRDHDLTIQLNVYGDGPLRHDLQCRVQAHRLPVTFHGWMPNAQERFADGCFAFASGRLAIQEAMARRRLVIATWVNPLKRDYVLEESFSPHLVGAATPRDIAAAVAVYAAAPEKRLARVHAAYAHVRQLTWSRTADGYLALWRTRRALPDVRRSRWRRTLVSAGRLPGVGREGVPTSP